MPITVNVKPWQGRPLVRRMAAIAAATLVTAGVAASTAAAAESTWPTAQALAANAAWVPYLDPPEKPAAVCLVDSGVDVTPDTPADSPEGPIVKRLALDGGSGTAANTSWEGLHGTRMAFTGVALRNGWGAAGFWPGARVVSVRAMPVHETGFPFDTYQRAIYICSQKTMYNVVAVNLSLGCECAPNEYERSALENRIVQAHSNELSVVAAAGNDGGPVDSPASAPGVLAVGASDKAGGLCSFSNRGTGLDLIAPGCDLELADPSTGDLWLNYQGGTSAASMMASVALALLRSYRPDLDWQTAESMVTHAGRSSAAGPVVDVEALFRASGLAALVDVAKARAAAAETGPGRGSESPGEAAGDTPVRSNDGSDISLDRRRNSIRRFPTPELGRVRRQGARVTVSVRNRPRGARLVVMVQRSRNEFGYTTIAHGMSPTDTVSLRLPPRWRGGRLVVRYDFRYGVNKTSPTIYKQLGV